MVSLDFWVLTSFPRSHADRTGSLRTWGYSSKEKVGKAIAEHMLQACWIPNDVANSNRGTAGSPEIQASHLSFRRVPRL